MARLLGWVWQNPLPQGNPLYSIHFAKDKQNGFAVGSDNTILRTRDGGFRWERQEAPTDVTYSGVWARDAETAIAVGFYAWNHRFDSINGGKDWKRVAVDARDHFYSIAFAGTDANVGWITGTYGRILKTTDGGTTWHSQSVDTKEHILKVAAFDADHAAAVGLGGTVLFTNDGGTSGSSPVRARERSSQASRTPLGKCDRRSRIWRMHRTF